MKHMSERRFISWVILLAMVAFSVLVLANSADAAKPEDAGQPAQVCPEEGKVESQVDGDLDDIVLDEGTPVCIFGAATQVNVVADGESTLRELLGLDRNVSHYTPGVPPSTTTTTQPTTTTSQPTTTTSTTEPVTPTTEVSTTTSTPEASSTTIVAESSTTMPEKSLPSTPVEELPYTGAGMGVAALLGAILSISGLSVLAMARREEG
jgi:LPXTG-motif cell wall-anchored protein